MDAATRERLKFALREKEYPTFSDEDLDRIWAEAGSTFEGAAYQGLLLKAEDDSIQVSGLSIAASAKYFRRLAARYRPSNTGILVG